MTPRENKTAKMCARIGAAVFASAALFAWIHLALGAHYRGFTGIHNVGIDVTLGTIWTIAAIAMAVPIARLAFFVVLGAWFLLIHGAFFAIGLEWPGLPFFAAAVAIGFLGAKASPLFRDPPAHLSGA